MLEQHADAGERGVEQRQAPAADQAGAGERREQQQAQAAGDAVARVEQHTMNRISAATCSASCRLKRRRVLMSTKHAMLNTT